MIGFIDDYRGAYGVEPICRVLKIAPSTYHAHDARRRRSQTGVSRSVALLQSPCRYSRAAGSLCAGHAQQLGGESPPPNLMEVKG